MSQKPKKKQIPNEIFLVETNLEFRIYTSEGQATNWAIKEHCNNAKLHRFVPKELKQNAKDAMPEISK